MGQEIRCMSICRGVSMAGRDVTEWSGVRDTSDESQWEETDMHECGDRQTYWYTDTLQ